MAGGGRYLDVAARAASYNVLLQVLLRFSTFLLNGFILRFIQAELLGVVNLRLTLLYNTVLFLSREALRKACLSQTTEERKWVHVFNLCWCSLPLGLLCSVALCALWLSPWIEQPLVSGDPLGVVTFALAAILELLVEPLWLLAQLKQYVTLKVMAEGLPQLLRCVVVVCGVLLAPQLGLTVFCAAQLTYSLGYVVIYYGYFSREVKSHDSHMLPVKSISGILPQRDGAKVWVSPHLLRLAWSFFKQSFLKQLLTDGERYVMTFFAVLNFAEQGVYDVINNLGSLAARFIFLPIEESFYVYFASSLLRGQPAEKQNKSSMQEAAYTLAVLLKLVLLIALTILSFGYAYSFLALDLYGGSLLSGGAGPGLLRWFCVYVLLLAVNGVTECFVFASMSQTHVDRYNRAMLLFSLLFLASSLLLTRMLGSVGFVLANCITMATRITHSCVFIQHFFAPLSLHPLLQALPSRASLAAFGLAFIATATSESSLCCGYGWHWRLAHIAVGVVTLSVVGMVIAFSEPQLVGFIVQRLPASPATQKLLSLARLPQQPHKTEGRKKKKH